MILRGAMAVMTLLGFFLIADAVVVAAANAEAQPEAAAGGLSFAANPSVRLESQDVLVVADRITVTYSLHNEAESPQSIFVSFALPDLEANSIAEGEIALAAVEPLNFVHYVTTVDGQPISLSAEQRATALGLDVTTIIGGAGMPLFPVPEALHAGLEKLSAGQRLEFLERGILKDDGSSVAPSWNLKTTAYWRQSFNPGQTITIQHSYRPIVGVVAANADAAKSFRARACVTSAHEAAIAKLSATGNQQPVLTSVVYSATPNADALGPARRFRLIVETGDAATIFASCREGLRQTGPHQLDWNATDYAPDEEFVFLFAR